MTAWLENVAAVSIHTHQTLLGLDDVAGHLSVGFLEELHHLWMHEWVDGWVGWVDRWMIEWMGGWIPQENQGASSCGLDSS